LHDPYSPSPEIDTAAPGDPASVRGHTASAPEAQANGHPAPPAEASEARGPIILADNLDPGTLRPTRTSHPQPAQADEATNQTSSSLHAPDAPPSPEPNAPRNPRVLALLNQKGGVGKTTTAANVAAALCAAGHNVLAIDLDPQAHLTLSLGLDPEQLEKSIYHLLTEPQTPADEVVQQASNEQAGRLDVLPSEVNLAGVESELAQKTVIGAAQTTLRDKTLELTKQYDYVILDCPPSLGILTINALATAHEVIVPMQAHFLALQGLSKLLETVQMVRQAINPPLSIAGIVLCMHEKQTVLAGEVVGDLEQFLEEARGTDSPWSNAVVFQPPVRRNIKLAECPSFGQSVFSYAPESNGAADYRQLAAHIARHRVVA
jgi:chromosome partitioning protein